MYTSDLAMGKCVWIRNRDWDLTSSPVIAMLRPLNRTKSNNDIEKFGKQNSVTVTLLNGGSMQIHT